MIDISNGEIRYWNSYPGEWDSYGNYKSLALLGSSLSVHIGIKGLRENPELVQIEIRDPFQPKIDRQVIQYDFKNSAKKIYWTANKVICESGPDILSEVIQKSPEFIEVIKEHFNIELT